MVKPRWLVITAVGLSSLACISISDHPAGRFEIVAFTVTPAGAPARTVNEAGFLRFGDMLSCDSGDICDNELFAATAISVVSYDWVGSGFVPVWAPERAAFTLPPWNGELDRWEGPIPIGNLSCVLTRAERNPLVLVDEACLVSDGTRVAVELVMDR